MHRIQSPVTLVALHADHRDALFELTVANREHLRAWLPWVDHVHVPQDTATFIAQTQSSTARGEAASYLIEVQGAFVGTIGLSAIEAGIGTVGYWLAADQQKKGYMIDALAQIKTIATGSLGLIGLRLDVLSGNTASDNVALRCGFRLRHTLDDGTVLHGKTLSRSVYVYP